LISIKISIIELIISNQNILESDIKTIQRSSSGETSGPDEDLNETIDAVSDDTKAETSQPMTTEVVAQKAVESAKYFGSMTNISDKSKSKCY
jgi:hypothetical protein